MELIAGLDGWCYTFFFDIWALSTRKLGGRPGNGAPLRARVASLFLPCERGLNSHTDVDTRPHLSLAL